MKIIATLLFVFALASTALSKFTIRETIQSADIGKIAGRWYEIAGPLSVEKVTCVTVDFTPRENGFLNQTILGTNIDGSKYREDGLLLPTDSPNIFNLYKMPYYFQWPLTYIIVDTDYDNYLVASMSINLPRTPVIQFGLILSRTNTMSADKYAELTDLLVNKMHVSRNIFGPIIQKDCKYWPVSQY